MTEPEHTIEAMLRGLGITREQYDAANKPTGQTFDGAAMLRRMAESHQCPDAAKAELLKLADEMEGENHV